MAFLIFLNQESHREDLVHKSDCILCVRACIRKHACVYRYGYMRYFSLMREGTHKGPRIWNMSLTIWY